VHRILSTVSERLPNAREVRARLKAEAAAEKQAAYERRYEARRLLFGKANGMQKNLPMKERIFVRETCRESYHAYLHDLSTGVPRWNTHRGPKWSKRLNPNRGDSTLSFKSYWVIWRKGNKAVYRHKDLPKVMKQRFLEMQIREDEIGSNPQAV
jgi:hypothetical protein